MDSHKDVPDSGWLRYLSLERRLYSRRIWIQGLGYSDWIQGNIKSVEQIQKDLFPNRWMRTQSIPRIVDHIMDRKLKERE